MILLRRYLIYLILVILVATGFTYISYKIYPSIGFVKNDIWRVLPSPGDANRDIYTRAFVSQYGTFALAKPEAAYFSASIDIEENLLSGNCSYKLTGEDIEAKWWAITLYDKDGFLTQNNEKLYSFNSENIDFNFEGGFEIYFANDNTFIAKLNNKNWLRSPEKENFSISMRIYLPGEEFFSNLKRINLPIVEKIRCLDE